MLCLRRLVTETLLGSGCKSLVQSHSTARTVLLPARLCLPTCQYNCHKIMEIVVKCTEEYLGITGAFIALMKGMMDCSEGFK